MSSSLETSKNSRIELNQQPDRLTLANSVLTFESGPAGTIARITHDDGRTDYAGPLCVETIEALDEVGQ